MEKKIYFHVGLAKTGSTFLQKNFFPYLKNIKYINTHKYRNCIKIIKKTNYKSYLISREFDRQLENEIKKITSYFPNVRIIIIFRRHDHWITSQYKRYVKNGWYWKFQDFYNDKDSGYWKNEDMIYLNKVNIIKKYTTKTPLVMCFEKLKKNPFSYLDKISKFLNCNYSKSKISLNIVHKSYSDKQLIFLQNFCRIFKISPPEYYPYQEIDILKINSNNKLKHWLFFRPWWFLYHLVMYFAILIPKSFIVKGPLIKNDYLESIRKKYKNDWDYIKNLKF